MITCYNFIAIILLVYNGPLSTGNLLYLVYSTLILLYFAIDSVLLALYIDVPHF